MRQHKQGRARAAGILLPVSSLPSPYGIGSFGKAAYEWVDFLCAAGQRYWQVLPLCPTSKGNSPYQSPSAFAGNPYFIDLDLLIEQGLLTRKECRAVNWGADAGFVDYEALRNKREALLYTAYCRFADQQALDAFVRTQDGWLQQYALFMALKKQYGEMPWMEWPEGIRLRHPAELIACHEAYRADIEFHLFAQFQFFQQWHALKRYANDRGVQIIGDIPIYVSMDSADTWANSELFLLDESKRPIDVAGCPPDYFSKSGQIWNNPLYRWDVLEAQGYHWWLERLRMSLSLFDMVRIDHFRGLESYYAIPHGRNDAVVGEWRKGPGIDFIRAIHAEFGGGCIIAEDLGILTSAVRLLLEQSGFPGMKVLLFAFSDAGESDYMPHKYENGNCVVYTGTHDNDTVQGWIKNASRADVGVACDYLSITDEKKAHWAFISAALMSMADLAVVPMQDYLGLDSEARFNTPATVGNGNWRWRIERGTPTRTLARRIARLTRLSGRCEQRADCKLR